MQHLIRKRINNRDKEKFRSITEKNIFCVAIKSNKTEYVTE